MSTALQLKEALKTVDSALLSYEDLSVAELVDTGELSMFYRLREDRVLLLKAIEGFGDFMARMSCKKQLEKAQHALMWLGEARRSLKC